MNQLIIIIRIIIIIITKSHEYLTYLGLLCTSRDVHILPASERLTDWLTYWLGTDTCDRERAGQVV